MFPLCKGLIAAALLSGLHLAAEVRSLTILHTNDLHARLSPLENKNGGFAYLASVIQRERANCSDCVLMYGGDLVQGSPVSTMFHGLPVYEIANLLGFDVATLGNHEFDYGWMQTRKFVQIAKFPIVTSNVVNARGDTLTPKPYTILNVNRLRIGVIGGMTDELNTLTIPKLAGEWHTTPLVETVRKYAAELRDKTDLVVLLGHITANEETEILNTVPGIAVQITGHVHRGMEQAQTHDGRVQVRVKSYGEELGRLELKVDTQKKALESWTWKRIPVDSTKVTPNPAVAKLVKKWEDEVTQRVDQPLAVSAKAFTRPEVKRLIERAIREETGSDFALMNQGGVRDALPQGQLLVRHIWNIMPFDNIIVVGRFKGKDLPPIVLGGRTVDPEREYTLAVSDFTAANQGTPENLQKTGMVFDQQLGLMRDILIDWFRKKKVIED
jgi:5'-nucleotidase / UDP-sugar diphosphatase